MTRVLQAQRDWNFIQRQLNHGYNNRVLAITIAPIITLLVFALHLLNIAPLQLTAMVSSPILFFILFGYAANLNMHLSNPGAFVFTLISIARYLLIPIFAIRLPYEHLIGGYPNEDLALMLFLVEETVLGCGAALLTIYLYEPIPGEEMLTVEPQHENYLTMSLVALSGLVIVILSPQVLQQYTFILSRGKETLIKGRWLIAGLGGVLLDLSKLILPLLLVKNMVIQYYKKERIIWYYLSCVVLLAFNTLFFSGTSRNSLIVPSITSLFFLLKWFPKRRLLTMGMLSFAIAGALVAMSLLKSSYVGRDNFSDIARFLDYLQAYFSGPKNIAVSLEAKVQYASHYSTTTYLTDIFGNFPMAGKILNLNNRTSTFYNLIFYHGKASRDQIIPMIGQGLFHHGLFLPWLPGLAVMTVFARVDQAMRRTRSLALSYILAMFAVRYGMFPMANLSVLGSFTYATLLPLMAALFMDLHILPIVRKYLYEKTAFRHH